MTLLPNRRHDPARTGILTLLAELSRLRLDCPPDEHQRRTDLNTRMDALLDRLNNLKENP